MNYLNKIALSIVVAKNNLINPFILDEKEIRKFIDLEYTQVSLSNVLTTAKINVWQNKDCIMVKITKLLEICKLLKLYHAQCREETRPVKNCITTTSETICSPYQQYSSKWYCVFVWFPSCNKNRQRSYNSKWCLSNIRWS